MRCGTGDWQKRNYLEHDMSNLKKAILISSLLSLVALFILYSICRNLAASMFMTAFLFYIFLVTVNTFLPDGKSSGNLKNTNTSSAANSGRETSSVSSLKEKTPGVSESAKSRIVEKINPDGTFWGVSVEQLKEHKEAIRELVQNSQIVTEEEISEFCKNASTESDLVKETGSIENSVDFLIEKIIDDAKLIRQYVRGIKQLHVECRHARGYMGSVPIVIGLWREFGGPNADCISYYIIRKTNTECIVRFMPYRK
jgi:hypothetical protein